ncbi:MAG: helix-turn-helix domain-containing protein [Alphaproteobacteria bacterium]|nr:helix-turn-helix domain-containing protein [Alphaproteobacteria bacterium]
MKGPRLAKRVDEHVGERIRQRRTMLGYTQEQLAGALNISYQQVQKYETGANRVSAGRLYEIASHLDIDMGYFFEGLAPTARSGPMPHGGRNRTTIELVRNFADIGDGELRNALSSLVKVLALRLGDEATRAIPVNGTDAAASNHGADGN